jgi:hypothetical protein
VMQPRILIGIAFAVTTVLVGAARATAPPVQPSAGAARSADGDTGRTTGVSAPGAPGSAEASAAGTATPSSALDTDLMTFAFAAGDVRAIDTTLREVNAAAESLSGASPSWSLARVRSEGEALRERANALGALADAARARLEPLAPADANLVAIRRDALTAYATAGVHADAAGQLAEFAVTFDPDAATGAAAAIETLGQAETNLATMCSELLTQLGAWQDAHPSEANAALTRYPALP